MTKYTQKELRDLVNRGLAQDITRGTNETCNAVIIRSLYNLYDSYINMLYYPNNIWIRYGNNEISKDTPINFYKQDLIVIKNKYKIPEIVLQEFNRIAIDHWHERSTI